MTKFAIVILALILLAGLGVLAILFATEPAAFAIDNSPGLAHTLASSKNGVDRSPKPTRERGLLDQRRMIDEPSSIASLVEPLTSGSAGVRLFGRVLDQHSRGASGVRLRIRGVQGAKTTSASNGRFEFPTRIGPGKYRIVVDGEGFLLYESRLGSDASDTANARALRLGQRFEIVEGSTEHELRVSVIRPASVHGRVLTTLGDPAAGYMLTHDPDYGGYRSWAVADDQGYFELFAPSGAAANGEEMTLRAGRCVGFGLPLQDITARWGDTGVEVIVRLAAQVTLEVVSVRGQPIERYGIYLNSMKYAALTGQSLNVPFARVNDPQGRTTLGVLPGPTYITVFPEAPGLLPEIAFVNVPQASAPRTLRMQLAEAPVVDVYVVANDRPVEGAMVTAGIRKQGHEGALLDAQLPDYDRSGGVPVPHLQHSGIVDELRTDEDGIARVTLRALPQSTLELSVTAPGYTPAQILRPLATVTSAGSVTIELDRSPEFRFVLEPREIYAFEPEIRLVGADLVFPPRGCIGPEDGKHEIVVRDLPLGSYSVDLSFGSLLSLSLAHQKVAHCELTADGGRFTLDLTSYMPVELRGTAFVDGKPAETVRLHPRINGDVTRGWIAQAQVGADGGFLFRAVPRILFGLSVLPNVPRKPFGLGTIPIVVSHPTQVVGEGPMWATIAETTRNATFLLQTENGVPIAPGTRVFVHAVSYPLMKSHAEVTADSTIQLRWITSEDRIAVRISTGSHAGKTGLETILGDQVITVR